MENGRAEKDDGVENGRAETTGGGIIARRGPASLTSLLGERIIKRFARQTQSTRGAVVG